MHLRARSLSGWCILLCVQCTVPSWPPPPNEDQESALREHRQQQTDTIHKKPVRPEAVVVHGMCCEPPAEGTTIIQAYIKWHANNNNADCGQNSMMHLGPSFDERGRQ